MQSLIKKYTNGYEAHWIDKHFNRNVFRDVNYYLHAFPEEQIVVLMNGIVVVYLKELKDLEELEKSLKLEEQRERA